jgi:hypothetical protein
LLDIAFPIANVDASVKPIDLQWTARTANLDRTDSVCTRDVIEPWAIWDMKRLGALEPGFSDEVEGQDPAGRTFCKSEMLSDALVVAIAGQVQRLGIIYTPLADVRGCHPGGSAQHERPDAACCFCGLGDGGAAAARGGAGAGEGAAADTGARWQPAIA